MPGSGRIPPRGGKSETEIGKDEALGKPGTAKPSPLVERGTPAPTIPEAQAQADLRRRFGVSKELGQGTERTFIDHRRIVGEAGDLGNAYVGMPFRILVHRNNLFGGHVHTLAFKSPGQRFTFGSKFSQQRNYKNLNESRSGLQDSVLVGTRDGYLHHRARVEDLEARIPNFKNLIRNQAIRPEQAIIEEKNGELVIRSLTREALVWVLDSPGWRPVGPNRDVPLKDGSWLMFGPNPGEIEGNTLDPQSHTVLRVELNRPKPLGPSQWNLVEFEQKLPEEVEKIPAPEPYLAALLGQSPEWTTWRFRSLFREMNRAGWSPVQTKEFLNRMALQDLVQAELRLPVLAEVVESAQRFGWSYEQLGALLLQPNIARRAGNSLFTRLPQLLEASSRMGISPSELTELVVRMAKYDPHFPLSLERLPSLFSEWRQAPEGAPRIQELIDFLDRTEVTLDFLGNVFRNLPGGRDVFLRDLPRLMPELAERHGLRGGFLAELVADIANGIFEYSLEPPPASGAWVSGVLEALPPAFRVMFDFQFRVMEQRAILLNVAAEQGMNFSNWWQAFHRRLQSGDIPRDRGFLEPYLQSEMDEVAQRAGRSGE